MRQKIALENNEIVNIYIALNKEKGKWESTLWGEGIGLNINASKTMT